MKISHHNVWSILDNQKVKMTRKEVLTDIASIVTIIVGMYLIINLLAI